MGQEPGSHVQCLGCERARNEPQTTRREAAVVALPPAVDTDVFHGAGQGAAVLHRPLLDARLRQLHAGRCDAAKPARDLEWRALPALPGRAAERPAAGRLRELRTALEPLMHRSAEAWRQAARASPGRPRVGLVIPTLNEEEPIAKVIGAVPRDVVHDLVVADSGSVARTVERARAAGARAVVESQRGYGRACAAGARSVRDCDIIVFLDGDGSDRPELIPLLLGPILAGECDFVIGSRTRGERERGSMSVHQIAAGDLAGVLTRLLYGVAHTDICAFRAIPPQEPRAPCIS